MKSAVKTITTRIDIYAKLIRFDKPIGSLLLLWPALIALLIANQGHPPAYLLGIFLAGTFLTRSAGCIINDITDRKLDQHIERTQSRPLAAGKIKVIEALGVMGVLLLLALLLVLLTNIDTIVIAIIAIIMMCLYPLMKRITHLPQAWLGIVFNLGTLMAFTASNMPLHFSAWLIYLSAFCSTMAYDTCYAMSDREEDLKVGIKSSAILFGQQDKRIVFIFQIISFALLVLLAFANTLNLWFYLGLLFAAICIGYQQFLIKDRGKADCFQAFLNHHYLWMFVFIGLVLSYL